MPEFKDMLKYFRMREKLSQGELAEKLGVSTSRISMYEAGKREPDFETEEKIADFFNTDLNTLRGRDTEIHTSTPLSTNLKTMAEDDYRIIFSKNLKYYMDLNNKTQMDLMKDLGLSSSTVSNWCTGLKLPRMDKVQMLADYFRVQKSDLIEEDGPIMAQKRKMNEIVLSHFNKLNDAGKHEATKRVEELTYIPRYSASVAPVQLLNAAHADVDTSDEDKKHDEDIMNDDKKWGV